MTNPTSINYYKNRGRETLWELKDDELYIVEGINSGTYECYREDLIRFALKDVVIRPYRTDIAFDNIPAVAFAQHINAIRKRDGLENVRMDEGVQTFWLGKKQTYNSINSPGVERVSMKLFRDIDVRRELREIERRIRTLASAWESVSLEEKNARIARTLKLVSRLREIVVSYQFIPWFSVPELKDRLERCLEVSNTMLTAH